MLGSYQRDAGQKTPATKDFAMLTQAVSMDVEPGLDARSVHVDSYYAATANRSTLRRQL